MNIKQRVAFDNLVKHSTMLQFPFDSSSQNFENDLKELTGACPIKLYYEYKYPNQCSARQYENAVQQGVYVLTVFSKEQILEPVKYYSDLIKRAIEFRKLDGANTEPVKQKYAKELEIVNSYLSKLSQAEKLELVDIIEGLKSECQTQIVAAVGLIKSLNPELQNVRVDLKNVYNMLDFLQGAVYGFAPQEIDYFLNTDMDVRNQETDKYYKQLESFGLRPYYVVRPDRLKQILDYVLIMQNINNGIGKEAD